MWSPSSGAGGLVWRLAALSIRPPPTPPPTPPRLKRESVLFPILIWKKMSTLWKTITLMAVLLGAGWSGALYVKSFDLRDDVAGLKESDRQIRDELRAIGDLAKSNAASVRAVEQTAKEMREDVRTLLQHMLENPPGRKPP